MRGFVRYRVVSFYRGEDLKLILTLHQVDGDLLVVDVTVVVKVALIAKLVGLFPKARSARSKSIKTVC